MAEKIEGLNVIPHDVNAERAILSACITDKEAIIDVTGKINKDDFFVEEHKVIFEAIEDLFNDNINVDLVVLYNKITANGYKGTVIDIPYLSEIASEVAVTDNVINYAAIIKDKSILRNVIKNNKEVLKECYAGDKPTSEILQQVESDVFKLLSQKTTSDYSHISEVIKTALEKIEELYANKGQLTGVPTGFTDLDRMTSGLQQNEMVLVAARPAMGKTAFAINIVENAAIKKGVPTAIFSLEMSKEQIGMEFLDINTNHVKRSYILKNDKNSINEALQKENERCPSFIKNV